MADISIQVEELDYPRDFDDDAALADELSLCRDQTKDILYALAKSTEDNNPDVLSMIEGRIILGRVDELRKARRQNQNALADKIFARCLSIFLKLKGAELAKRDAFIAGGIKEFQVPKISFNKLKLVHETGERDSEDTIVVHKWITHVKDKVRRNQMSTVMALELAKAAVPEVLQPDVQNALDLDDMYKLVAKCCPTVSMAARYIKDKLVIEFEGGRLAEKASTSDVIKKAKIVLDRIKDLAGLSTLLDFSRQEVELILMSFGTQYGGTAESIKNHLNVWHRKFLANDSLMHIELRKMVESIRAMAYSNQDSERRIRDLGSSLSKPDKTTETTQQMSRRIATLETHMRGQTTQSRDNTNDSGGQRDITCYTCGKSGHTSAFCPSVIAHKYGKSTLPSHICMVCLNDTTRPEFKGKKHFADARNGCNIGSASRRQKDIQKDRNLLRDNYCYDHKVNINACRECFQLSGGKGAETSKPPKYIPGGL